MYKNKIIFNVYIKYILGHYDAKSSISYSLISKIDTNSSITYNMSYEIEDSLTFYECPHNPHRSSKEIFVTNQDNHIYHSIEDTTIRFFTVTKIGTQGKKKQNINFQTNFLFF